MNTQAFISENFHDIDRLAVQRVPGYANLDFDQRIFAVKWVMEYQLPYMRVPQPLGMTGAEIAGLVIAIIAILASLSGTIIGLAVNSSKEKDQSRIQASADTINAQASTVETSAATIEAENKQKETTAKIALGTVVGIGAIAAFLTFT